MRGEEKGNKMKTIEQLRALVEAGEKANQDSWHVVGLPWNNHTPYINTESEDPHLGRAIIDVIETDCIEGEDDADIARKEAEMESEMYANMEFVSKSANSRPALAALLEALESVDMDELDEALENVFSDYQKAELYRQKQNENFVGMNKDRPQKSDGVIVYEAAHALRKMMGE